MGGKVVCATAERKTDVGKREKNGREGGEMRTRGKSREGRERDGGSERARTSSPSIPVSPKQVLALLLDSCEVEGGQEPALITCRPLTTPSALDMVRVTPALLSPPSVSPPRLAKRQRALPTAADLFVSNLPGLCTVPLL